MTDFCVCAGVSGGKCQLWSTRRESDRCAGRPEPETPSGLPAIQSDQRKTRPGARQENHRHGRGWG